MKETVNKPKRQQVKNACVNCQKACKKCDDGRPCKRCIKIGITDTCRNSDRKERKKGIKRGPYKKKSRASQDEPVVEQENNINYCVPSQLTAEMLQEYPVQNSSVPMMLEHQMSISGNVLSHHHAYMTQQKPSFAIQYNPMDVFLESLGSII